MTNLYNYDDSQAYVIELCCVFIFICKERGIDIIFAMINLLYQYELILT